MKRKRFVALTMALCILFNCQIIRAALEPTVGELKKSIGTEVETSKGKVIKVDADNFKETTYNIEYGDKVIFFSTNGYLYSSASSASDAFDVTNEEVEGKYCTSFTAIKAGSTLSFKVGDTDITLNSIKRKLEVKAVIADKEYDGTAVAKFLESPVVCNVLSSDQEFTYTYENPKFYGKAAGEQKVQNIEFSCSNSNYEIEDLTDLKARIKKKKVSIIKTKIKTKVYDGTLKAEFVEKPELDGGVQGDDIKLSVPEILFSDEKVGVDKEIQIIGTFALYGDDSDNYELDSPGKLSGTIEKAKLVYKADDKSRKYGEETRNLTYTVSGFVAGDKDSDFQEPILTLDIPRLTSLGKHKDAIQISGAQVPDYYDVIYEYGDLYVNANDISKGDHFQISEPDGDNGWFVNQNFVISPVQGETSGYDLIAVSADGPWLKKLSFDQDTKSREQKFYLKDSKTGAISKVGRQKYKLDKTRPEVENIEFAFLKGYHNIRKFNDFKCFFDYIADVSVTASDATSGVNNIRYYTKNEDRISKTKIEKGSRSSFKLHPNFKGNVVASAVDNAGNESDAYQSAGVILEDNGQHSVTSFLKINQETENKKYYNHDIFIGLEAEDTYSGIQEIKYKAGSSNSASISFNKMKHQYTKKGIRISAEENNKNYVEAKFSMVDNTGHNSIVKKHFNIDVSKPEIEVSYNNNQSEGQYFKNSRVATITIKERNFNQNKTYLDITKNGKKYRMKSNFVSDGVLHAKEDGSEYYNFRMNIPFKEDGEYHIDVSSTDLAGNKNESVAFHGNHPRDFVIDQTDPKAQINFDNMDVQNQKYYKADRTASINIVEKNFDPAKIHIDTNGHIGKWTSNGKRHSIKVIFNNNKKYHLSIMGKDKAGNTFERQSVKEFIIDKIKPAITKITPENGSANAGRITCGYTVTDQYLASHSNSLDGYKKKQKFNSKDEEVSKGFKVTYNQIPNLIENDDYYTLKVTATDKAGNQSTKTVVFTVNRFGSVYKLDDNARSINGTYVKEAKDIIVKESNPNHLTQRQIRLIRDNEKVDLREEDYSITYKEGKWNECIYQIKKSAFKPEGVYRIIISSKDSAKHISSNDMAAKKATISFGIDRTKPTIIASNIERGKVYAQDGKTANFIIKDNLLLEEVSIYKNGQLSKEYKGKISEQIKVPLLRKDGAQSIRVVAHDAAGNEKEVFIDNIYITKNLWIRFTHNTPAMLAAGIGLLLIILFFTSFIKKKHEKNEDVKKEDQHVQ